MWPKQIKVFLLSKENNTNNTIQTFTICGISQLSADHPCINGGPEVITHCAPHTVQTDLHSAFKFTLASNKS